VTGAVRTQREGGIVTLVLDNPAKRNSLDFPLLAQLRTAAHDIAEDHSIVAVVLRGGDDKAFCAGADFDALTSYPVLNEGVTALEAAMTSAIQALDRIAVPIIAAIRGACIGGGVQLALAADIRIASADSRFGIPAAQIGIAYSLQAITQLVALAGAGSAAQIFLTAEPFDASIGLQRRLIDEVVETSALEDRLRILMNQISASPRSVLAAYKGIIRKLAFDNDMNAAERIQRDLADSKCFLAPLEQIARRRKNRI
jgi:enoyl-CoA hydratase